MRAEISFISMKTATTKMSLSLKFAYLLKTSDCSCDLCGRLGKQISQTKINFSGMDLSWPTPLMSLSVPSFSLDIILSIYTEIAPCIQFLVDRRGLKSTSIDFQNMKHFISIQFTLNQIYWSQVNTVCGKTQLWQTDSIYSLDNCNRNSISVEMTGWPVITLSHIFLPLPSKERAGVGGGGWWRSFYQITN